MKSITLTIYEQQLQGYKPSMTLKKYMKTSQS